MWSGYVGSERKRQRRKSQPLSLLKLAVINLAAIFFYNDKAAFLSGFIFA